MVNTISVSLPEAQISKLGIHIERQVTIFTLL